MMDRAKYTEIGRRMRALPPEKPALSHEWEELVQRLCGSDDQGLHDIGLRENNELMHKRLQKALK